MGQKHRITSTSCPLFLTKRTFIGASLHVRFVPIADLKRKDLLVLT